MHDVVVDAVFDVGRAIGHAENPLHVRFVLGEQQRRIARAVEIPLAQFGIDGFDDCSAPAALIDLLQAGPLSVAMPRPLIAEPERRQQMQLGRFGAAVVHRDVDQDVVGRRLAYSTKHIEVAVLVEHARVEQLVFEFVAPAARLVSTSLA